MSSEERGKEPAKECMHKTKVIQFLGRSTPVILQNDNGPCPLIAVCNVLLLRNNLNLNSDVDEVSQEKLLSLVAERLIDSNSNVNNKDAGYLENQQQNIADAIDLLPRLATGVDVNLRFRRIDDFEFTPECAIFDLLDIPLYHGWILDPQDYDTCSAVGSKSYNVIMSELVALEALSMDLGCKNNPEDDSVDFAAATTATLGVPSPCLSRSRSFDESLQSVSGNQKLGKGDVEEEAELLRILQLSEVKMPKATENPKPVDSNGQIISDSPNENTHNVYSALEQSVSTTDVHAGDDNKIPHYATSLNQCSVSLGDSKDLTPIETIPGEVSSSGTADQQNQVGKHDISISVGDLVEKGSIGISEQIDLKEDISTNAVVDETIVDSLVQNRSTPLSFTASDSTPVSEEQMDCFLDQSTSMADINEQIDPRSACNMSEFPSSSAPDANSGLSHDRSEHASETLTSNVDTNEPIYEGEDCVLNSRKAGYAGREPVYEGEVVLAEQADKTTIDDGNTSSIDGITSKQGELIRNFLKNNANQLTVYGLFCLQDGLKERELCVFFRNNHFSTMFKLDGHLYLLATDQGYINQPDLVWEKLNEVNGDTVFMTSNFKEFKTDSHADNAWNEQNARANTADYLASVDSSAQASSNLNSDLQLAIALQQQEFEQQSQCHNSKQPSASGSSGLITGPQVPRNSGRSSSSASKPETKSKEKCIIM